MRALRPSNRLRPLTITARTGTCGAHSPTPARRERHCSRELLPRSRVACLTPRLGMLPCVQSCLCLVRLCCVAGSGTLVAHADLISARSSRARSRMAVRAVRSSISSGERSARAGRAHRCLLPFDSDVFSLHRSRASTLYLLICRSKLIRYACIDFHFQIAN